MRSDERGARRRNVRGLIGVRVACANTSRGCSCSSWSRVRAPRRSPPSPLHPWTDRSLPHRHRPTPPPSKVRGSCSFRPGWRQSLVTDAARWVGSHPSHRHRGRVPVRVMVPGRFSRRLPLRFVRRGGAPRDQRERIRRGARDRHRGACARLVSGRHRARLRSRGGWDLLGEGGRVGPHETFARRLRADVVA
jgi:hypothetical protein